MNTYYAILGRGGDTGVRSFDGMPAFYKRGVELALAGDVLQVWSTDAGGNLLGYDGRRTQTLTDKIIKARAASRV